MTQPGLFDQGDLRQPVLPLKREERTAGQVLRDRQRARIEHGCHPLSTYGVCIPLHPDAPRNAYQGDPREYPRCGTCIHRHPVGGHARDFPKCLIGYVERDLTEEEIAANKGTLSEHATRYISLGPRYSASASSDVRAWWPACDSYEGKEDRNTQ